MTQVLLELNLVSIDAITAKNFVLDLHTGGMLCDNKLVKHLVSLSY